MRAIERVLATCARFRPSGAPAVAFSPAHSRLAGLTFVVPKHRRRLVNHLVARSPGAQAQIDVIEVYGKCFVETTQIFKDGPAQSHTGARHGGNVACHIEPVPVRRGVRMSGPAHYPYDDSSVLDRAGWIQQPGPCNSYFRPGDVTFELRQPFAMQGLYIII